jgi:hypothetical protein
VIGLEPVTRPAGLIARRHQKDDRLPGQREAIVLLYAEERRATAAVPVGGGSSGPVHVFRVHGAGHWYARRRWSRAIGKAPHPVASPRGSTHPPDRRGYTPGVPESRRGGSDRGGPAIARSGRVVRPVRRPSDRQTNRRFSGGDPREICNQIPSPGGRDLSIPGTSGSRSRPRAVALVALRTTTSERRPEHPGISWLPPSPVVMGATTGAGRPRNGPRELAPPLVVAPRTTARRCRSAGSPVGWVA